MLKWCLPAPLRRLPTPPLQHAPLAVPKPGAVSKPLLLVPLLLLHQVPPGPLC